MFLQIVENCWKLSKLLNISSGWLMFNENTIPQCENSNASVQYRSSIKTLRDILSTVMSRLGEVSLVIGILTLWWISFKRNPFLKVEQVLSIKTHFTYHSTEIRLNALAIPNYENLECLECPFGMF